MAIIKTKVPFDGYRANVLFKNGVGETNNPYLISWFKTHGYEVVEPTNSPKPTKTKAPKVEINLEDMGVHELREYLRDKGCEDKIVGINKKSELLKIAKEVK